MLYILAQNVGMGKRDYTIPAMRILFKVDLLLVVVLFFCEHSNCSFLIIRYRTIGIQPFHTPKKGST